MVTFSMIFMDP